MSANATGITSWATHTGTPAAISVSAMRSTSTSSIPARHSSALTAAATDHENAWATSRQRPAGMNAPVASASSLFSRAARAAPRNATTRVRCWTNGADPGIPTLKAPRSTISAIGSTAIADSAAPTTNVSVR